MDDIQRKLALIDAQLAGRADFLRKIINTTPLLFAAAGLIIGVVIQNTIDLPIHLWLILLLFFALAAVSLFALKVKSSSYALMLLCSCALICFACLGAVRLTYFHLAKPNDIRNFVNDDRILATIRGTIITEPYVNKNRDWKFAKFQHTDPPSSFYLKINEVKSIDNWAKVVGTVRVQIAEPVLDLKAGDYIQAYCWLDRFKPAANPGQFDVAKYLAGKNIFIAASVKSRDGIELLKSRGTDFFTKII